LPAYTATSCRVRALPTNRGLAPWYPWGMKLVPGPLLWGLLAALALSVAACGKADRGKCEQMCRHFAEISFRDAEASKLPPDQRAKALADKLARGLDFCVNKCQSANNDSQIDCMLSAKSLPELRSCE
jgi:hypothetical protein